MGSRAKFTRSFGRASPLLIAGAWFAAVGFACHTAAAPPFGESSPFESERFDSNADDSAGTLQAPVDDGTSEPSVLPLLCPACGINGGGDTTDFSGTVDSSDPFGVKSPGCLEVVTVLDVDEARRRGHYPETSWDAFAGSWDVPITWVGRLRQTRLQATIEPTGQVVVIERFRGLDAGAHADCSTSVSEGVRVSLGAADGSVEGQLAGATQVTLDAGNYRHLSLYGSTANLRGNLELGIDSARLPRELWVGFDLYEFETGFAARAELRLDVLYGRSLVNGVWTNGIRQERLTVAGPSDGCPVHGLPLDGGCVPVNQHFSTDPQIPDVDAGKQPSVGIGGDAGADAAP